MGLRRLVSAAAAAVSMSSALVGVFLPAGPAAAEEVIERPADGVYVVDGHGNGHGRGLSQWGAQGAAGAGVGYQAILDSYYPGTVQVGGATGNIRVQISADDNSDTMVTAASRLRVTAGSCTLSSLPAGPAYWRAMVAVGALRIESSTNGSSWTTYSSCGSSLGTTVSFDVAPPAPFTAFVPVTLVLPGGVTRDLRGVVSATLAGGTITTVNVLTLEEYLRGVVPRQTPSWFQSDALRAQAVASRSYAVYSRSHAAVGALYDVCDTSACQVYGGIGESSGGVVSQFEQANTDNAVSTTAGVIRTYGGAAIAAEFSASSGGWSVASGLPYMPSQADPYDGLDSRNTSFNWTATLPVSAIEAAYPAVGRLVNVHVVSRDGNGEWGGRVGSVVLEGTDASGSATSVATDGAAFMRILPWPANASGMHSEWWHIRPVYDAQISFISADPTLVRPPGAASTSYVDLTNTGRTSWDPALLHLTLSSSPGSIDPLTGDSTPGVFVSNLSTGDGSAVQPGQVARIRLDWDAIHTVAGSYHPAYRVMHGITVFGPVVSWNVAVANPLYSAKVSSGPTLAPGAARPTFSPRPVQPGGGVAVARNGRTTVRLTFRNTSNVAWPLRGAVQVGTAGPYNRRSQAYGKGWVTLTRPARITGVVGKPTAKEVAPGEVGSADVTLWGNNRPAGTVKEAFDLVWEGKRWLTVPVTLQVTRIDTRISRAAERVSTPAAVTLADHPSGTTLMLRLRNIGASPWRVGGTDVLAMVTAKDQIRLLGTGAWLSPTRSTSLVANVSSKSNLVYPGEVGEWRVPINAFRKAPGVYSGTMRVIDTKSRVWYGPAFTTRVTVVRSAFRGTFVRAAPGIVVPRRGNQTVYVDVRNTSNFTWKVAGPIRLAVVARGGSGSRAAGWLSAVKIASIATNVSARTQLLVRPGQVARFTFKVAGNGRAPGSYTEKFGVVWEGWQSASVRATVRYVVR